MVIRSCLGANDSDKRNGASPMLLYILGKRLLSVTLVGGQDALSPLTPAIIPLLTVTEQALAIKSDNIAVYAIDPCPYDEMGVKSKFDTS
jgi:hypothetical protein